MKIMHVVQLLYANGGIERLVLAMLKKNIANTYVFVLQGSTEESLNNVPALAAYQDKLYFANLDENGKKKTIRYLRALCNALSITAIHTHYTGPLLYANLATMGLNPMVHVHTEHDVWHLKVWKNYLLEKILLNSKKNIHLVAVSKQVQMGLRGYFTHKNPLLIHNGVDTFTFRPGDKEKARAYFNLSTSVTIIGSAGTLIPIKGHRFLIQSMRELPDFFHLAIAGSGPLFDDLTALIHEMKMEKRIHLLGSVENMDLFYQACDLFCHPSINEGLPLALLEAQSSNLPTVCSDVGGCSEALDPESSLLIAPENSKAIAQACLLVEKKRGTPRNFIVNNFSLDAMMDKYNLLYKGM